MNTHDAHQLLTMLLHRIAPDVDLATVDPDAPMQDEMDLDSMDFLSLLDALHDETGIDVPERDYQSVATVARFVSYVASAPVADS